MALDAVKNFGKVTVSTGYDAAATSIVLSGSEGAKLPAPATDGLFNLVWYNATDYNDPTDDPNREIVRVTARSTDTLTVTRAQEGTSASTKNTSAKTYKMILAVTAKTIEDIDAQIYGVNDIYGLWTRKIDYGFTPDEHWAQNADQLSWTGYATYTGFVTPGSITTSLSTYKTAHSAAAKSFRYRSAATGGQIYLRTRCGITFQVSAGVMVDDGVDDGDSEGATNFYRVYATQSTLGGPVTIVEQYRTGGGAVTTNVGPTMPYGEFFGIGLRCVAGTLWSSWSANPFTFGESQEAVQFTGGTAPMSWTPARVGLYGVYSAVDFGRKAMFDWYDEATT